MNGWRRIALIAAISAAALAARADEILYWMVDNPTIHDFQGGSFKASEAGDYLFPLEGARVAAFLTTDAAKYGSAEHDSVVTYLSLYYGNAPDPEITDVWIEDGVSGSYGKSSYVMSSLEMLGGNLSEYSFAIELGAWDYDEATDTASWMLAAASDAKTYAELEEFRSSQLKIAGAVPWNPTSYMVPEPTGGLLILIGGALLALKRKRFRC